MVNLSNTKLSTDELIALELGYGFVVTPNNPIMEEETLILEGFRFLDRLGKTDARLAEMNVNPPDVDDIHNSFPTDTNADDIHNSSQDSATFFRNNSVPQQLQFSQPKEPQLSLNKTKIIKSEFDELNKKLIESVKSKSSRRKFNLPQRTRDALKHLKELVRDKIIDIRKVDKGQLLLIVDYTQRKKAEELNILQISSICTTQSSNWNENKEFVENTFKDLLNVKFITEKELTAVTGLLAGGKTGKLKNKDGSLKFTRVTSSNELFAKQVTPYVYPLFKAHKLSMDELLQIKPNDVHLALPSRLVVGMRSCQLSRVQLWLENFLSPLARLYGSFEYIKDSSDYLINLENIKTVASCENWDWEETVLFTVDVQALYPSVKFEHLVKALHQVLNTCTIWCQKIKDIIVNLILYTLQHQQIYWDGKYYMLNKGLPTGAKHSVPLSNILLTFILLDSLNTNSNLNNIFSSQVKLWKRFIDDGTGIFKGKIEEFLNFFSLLQISFAKYGLALTCDTDTHKITESGVFEKVDKFVPFLDIELFKYNGTLHTREHRKETSTNSYLSIKSAHPRHTFPGIVKSQLYRLRRICSLQTDFEKAIQNLEKRCLNSGYNSKMVKNILNQAAVLERILVKPENNNTNEFEIVRLVILAGTGYEVEFCNFAKRMNSIVQSSGIHIEIVKSTSMTLSQLLFNNNDKMNTAQKCSDSKCLICKNNIRCISGEIESKVTNSKFPVDSNMNCENGGIYAATGACSSQYTGKTVNFCGRFIEHFSKSKLSTIYSHRQQCNSCNNVGDFEVTYIENYHKRGKYSLSEREYLWNHRIKGTMNIQKTLKEN